MRGKLGPPHLLLALLLFVPFQLLNVNVAAGLDLNPSSRLFMWMNIFCC
jgi:hypothetical protein